MNGIPHFRKLPAVLFASMFLTMDGHAEAFGRLSSRFLARGEQVLLEIAVSGVQPAAFPEIPAVGGVEIRQAGKRVRTQLLAGRRLEYCFDYLISSYAVGSHVIPPVEVMAGGLKTRTEPLEFSVFNPDDLKWSETQAGGAKIRYASAFRIMNPRPYDGETTPVEIKLFVPSDLFVEDWGIPDFQREGITCWRFQPSPMRGAINLLGRSYQSVAYPSTLTTTRAGKLAIGPAALRLITTQVMMDGILRRVSQELNLTVPQLEIDAKPLPDGAPAGFENAVGSFKMDVKTTSGAVQEGDPIPVDIVVSGSGNLDTLHVPKPLVADGWKVYDATTESRGDERRELSGTTVFHQFMRPLELKPEVPGFRLVYFDPKNAMYKTLTTEPILLQMTPARNAKAESATPPEALTVPIERMTDILGVVRTAHTTRTGVASLPTWFGHALAAWLALVLIIKAILMRFGHRLKKGPGRHERVLAIREMERVAADDDPAFLLLAGRFIERWLGDHPSPEIRDVLASRDAVCFLKEKPRDPVMESKQRSFILKLLRSLSITLSVMLLLVIGVNQSRAADLTRNALKAYDAAEYDEAIRCWLQGDRYEDLAADTLFNIGNACYRAGSPGYAALYYRRALARDPDHQESRQNLRFIERKCGALTVHRPEYQYVLARFPLRAWQALLWAGIWLWGLAVLIFPATRPGARIRMVALAALLVGPLLAATGALGWHYFPNDAEFAAPERQAVIVGDKVILHAEAARTSPEVIDAPPGSLCELIQESGRWAYIAFATKTRGWVPVEMIEKVVPTRRPEVPAIRKPKADRKSA
jgi:hypothetical protein